MLINHRTTDPIPFQKWGLNSSLPIFAPRWVRGYVVKLTQETNGGSQFLEYSIKLGWKVNKLFGQGDFKTENSTYKPGVIS